MSQQFCTRLWFKANKLSVNASKTNYMIMGTPRMTSIEISDEQSNGDIILDNRGNLLRSHAQHKRVLLNCGVRCD